MLPGGRLAIALGADLAFLGSLYAAGVGAFFACLLGFVAAATFLDFGVSSEDGGGHGEGSNDDSGQFHGSVSLSLRFTIKSAR